MRQPGANARGFRADGGAGLQGLGPDEDAESATGPADIPPPRHAGDGPDGQPGGEPLTGRSGGERMAGQPGGESRIGQPRLPPGQYVQASLPVLHYGPVPACNPQTWDLRVYGATEAARERRWTWDGFRELPRTEIVTDFHCVTKFTVLGLTWLGVPAAEVLRAVPPARSATHVMVWADFGYGANLPLDAFAAAQTLLATHCDGKELTPEHGYPVRLVVPSRYGWKNVKWVRAIEYMIGDRRGFWEERGYHNNADPWREQRYSYQELPGEGPAL